MEGPSNGGLLYHEVQEGKLCAVHCVNTVLQGPYFSELDLAALASDLDKQERQVLMQGGDLQSEQGDFLSDGSHNVSLEGNFSIQVLQKALEVWDLEAVPLDAPAQEESVYDPAERETAFICHQENHWFCIRKVNGEWYNFNSLYPAPEHLSKFYLSAYIDSLKASGWTIFTVKGNFPKECNLSAEAGSGFGQWLMPDDAKNITASCNKQQTTRTRTADIEKQEMDMLLATTEDEDLNAAILASLMDANNNNPRDGTHLSGTGEGSGTVGSEDPASEAVEGSIRHDRDNIEEGYASSDPKPRYDH
ncbi:josephin family protein [Carex rostrata]